MLFPSRTTLTAAARSALALRQLAHRRAARRRAVVDQVAWLLFEVLLLRADGGLHADVLVSVVVGNHDRAIAEDLAFLLSAGGTPAPSPLCPGRTLDCARRGLRAQSSVRGDERALLHLLAHRLPAGHTPTLGTWIDCVGHTSSPR